MSGQEAEEAPKESGKPKLSDFQKSRLSKLMANPVRKFEYCIWITKLASYSQI